MSDKVKLGDWLNSINSTKVDIMTEENKKSYPPYVINHSLSNFPDSLFYAEEMNGMSHLPVELQYDYLRGSLRSRKRFSKWYKPKKDNNIGIIAEYYDCGIQEAKEYRVILSDSDINEIEEYLNFEGGIER